MQEFKINQEGIKQIIKKALIISVPILLIALSAGVFISPTSRKDNADEPNILPIIIPILLLSTGIGIYNGLRRRRNLLETYTLIITNNLITREQINTPTISLYFNEITKIFKHKNNSFSIIGKNDQDIIIVPSQINNYSQVESMLNNICPITIKQHETIMHRYPVILALIAIGLMICVYTLQNKIIVGISGALLISIILWSISSINKNKSIDSQTKKGANLVWIVLLMIILMMIIKLSGIADLER